MIYNKIEFIHKISINIKDLNSVNNIDDILYSKLLNLQNKCFEYGYVKENSIKILKKSSGYLNPIIFVPFIEYKLLCSAEVFKPNINDIYLVEVLSINKIAIMCCIKYTYKNKTIIPIRIIVAKHTQNEELLNNIQKGSNIYIKIIGYKFTKNSINIDSIANILSNQDIKKIKELKLFIHKLNSIEHNCKIDVNKINIYINILKFILEKDIITYNELFIYHFIEQNKITINTVDFENIYNVYIENFYNKKNSIQNNYISIDDCETNPDDDTCFDDDLTLDDDNLDSYDYNYIEDNMSKKNKFNKKQSYHELVDVDDNEEENNEEDEEEEEDEEDEEEEENDMCEEKNNNNISENSIKKII